MPKTKNRQANFTLPVELIEELRRQVPKGDQSRIVAEALRKELMRIRYRRALESSFGAWENNKHPELKNGTEKFFRRLRHSSRLDTKES